MDAILDTNANKKHKDSVFRLLFGTKDIILELYNAIMDTHYGPNTEVSIITLENALYAMPLNDISFILDGKLVVLIEHQSTVNENMPLRMLLYIARSYERWTEDLDIYRKDMLTIPRPEFIVLYNGVDKLPDDMELKLSDMFAKSDKKHPANLELAVKVYNINKGHNPEMAQRSTTLNGYEEFIARSRYYKNKGMALEQAVDQATEDCIKDNILANFLKTYRSEVRNMLTTEWKLEDALKVSRMEGKEEVAKKMLAKGMEVNTIAELTGLTVDEILRMKR